MPHGLRADAQRGQRKSGRDDGERQGRRFGNGLGVRELRGQFRQS